MAVGLQVMLSAVCSQQQQVSCEVTALCADKAVRQADSNMKVRYKTWAYSSLRHDVRSWIVRPTECKLRQPSGAASIQAVLADQDREQQLLEGTKYSDLDSGHKAKRVMILAQNQAQNWHGQLGCACKPEQQLVLPLSLWPA